MRSSADHVSPDDRRAVAPVRFSAIRCPHVADVDRLVVHLDAADPQQFAARQTSNGVAGPDLDRSPPCRSRSGRARETRKRAIDRQAKVALARWPGAVVQRRRRSRRAAPADLLR